MSLKLTDYTDGELALWYERMQKVTLKTDSHNEQQYYLNLQLKMADIAEELERRGYKWYDDPPMWMKILK